MLTAAAPQILDVVLSRYGRNTDRLFGRVDENVLRELHSYIDTVVKPWDKETLINCEAEQGKPLLARKTHAVFLFIHAYFTFSLEPFIVQAVFLRRKVIITFDQSSRLKSLQGCGT